MVIGRLECTKRKIESLALEAARLEGLIAGEFLQQGKVTKATVNLISQASCLFDARDIVGAVSVLNRAHDLNGPGELRSWIHSELERLII